MERKSKMRLGWKYVVRIDGVYSENGQKVEVVGIMVLDAVPSFVDVESWIGDLENREELENGVWIALKFLDERGEVDYIPEDCITILAD